MKKDRRFMFYLMFTAVWLTLSAHVRAVNVDVYQNMTNGNDGDFLTEAIMDASSHGGVDADATWSWSIYSTTTLFWVSDSFVRQLPGTVTVNGINYTGASAHTWKFYDKNETNYVSTRFGNVPRTWPISPMHDRITLACYYTPGQTGRFDNNWDTIIIGGGLMMGTPAKPVYAVMQTIGNGGSNPPYIRAHTDYGASTGIIKVVPGKTYWVNLHYDGPAGKCYVAAFDPDNGFAQVGDTVEVYAWPGSQIGNEAKFGRADKHANNTEWPNDTYAYFSHIMIDYTEAKFPLLPDIGSDYWVSPTGTATWANAKSATPLNGSAACSLATANTNARAGDTVYLREGTYLNGTTAAYNINPTNSGTVSARITYSNYNNERVTISGGDTTGISIRNKSYITVRGINFYNIKFFMSIFNSHHNIVEYCVFDKSLYISQNTWPGAEICNNSQYNWVHHCTFSKFGGYNGSTHSSDMLIVGYWSYVPIDDTSYNLIENNDFFYGGHSNLTVGGNHNVIRDNYLHNEAWASSNGYIDAITYGPTAYLNLFERNIFSFSGEGGGITLRTGKDIFRSNLFYRNYGGGITINTELPGVYHLFPAEYNHIYNNVFFKNGWGAVYTNDMGGINFHGVSTTSPYGAAYNVIKNNIFHLNMAGVAAYDYGWKAPNTIDNNWAEQGDPLFVYSGDGSDLDPFGAKPDFRLKPASLCIDAGTFLTTITSPSGTGTQFTVADALYFMDGWGITNVQGDEIQLFGTTQRARITNVNYGTNTITVDKTLNWTTGQGVSLAYEGAAPDLGAYEYVPGIALNSPTGGETWVRGFSHNITWSSSGVTEPAKIELFKDSALQWDVTVPIASGTSKWQIPTNQAVGSDYTIKISAGSYSDTSDPFTIAAPAAPIVQTLAAQSVTVSSASLRGTVNPMGVQTDYYFEYGPTTTYGFKTTDVTLAAGDTITSVQAALSGLIANTTYHFRLVATNSAGTTNGNDMSFTTSGGGGGGGSGDSGGGGGGGGCFIAAIRGPYLWFMVFGLVAGWVVWTVRMEKSKELKKGFKGSRDQGVKG